MTTAVTSEKDFGSRLYNRLALEKSGQKLFLSPFSIKVALAMCARGAADGSDTRKCLADLIGAPALNVQQDAAYKELIESVNGDGGERSFQLVTANALWGQEGSEFNVDYLKAVADDYDGAFNVVDYINAPDAACKTVNTWVEEKTKDKIHDLITRDLITKDTRLILTNAIYFKGKWDDEFEEEFTKDEVFFNNSRTTSQVKMMHKQRKYSYFEGDGFQVVDIPYKGGQLSFMCVLPTNKDGLPPMETRWHEEGLYSQVLENLDYCDVVLSLPRFKLETELKLKAVLKAMGADLAFSDAAQFKLIGKEALKISEVVHKAFVEVNEEGTEAAAATGVVMMRCSAVMHREPPKVFKADHPFMFLIRDKNTNEVLFQGHFTNQ